MLDWRAHQSHEWPQPRPGPSAYSTPSHSDGFNETWFWGFHWDPRGKEAPYPRIDSYNCSADLYRQTVRQMSTDTTMYRKSSGETCPQGKEESRDGEKHQSRIRLCLKGAQYLMA